MPEKVYRSSWLTLLLLVGSLAGAAQASADQPEKRVLSLTASGSVKLKPDVVSLSAGVESDAQTAKDALARNNLAMEKVVGALKDAGIDAKDIQTANFSVDPRYEDRNDGKQARLTGYHVANAVDVRLRDVGKLGDVLDTLVGVGANSISGISFGLADPKSAENEARKQAVSAAFAKAKIYADAAGAELGPVLSISEQGGYRPYTERAAAPMAAAAKAVPIEAGTTEVEVQLNVTFELD